MHLFNDTRFAAVSELKRDPRGLVKEAGGEPIIILNHNKPEMVLISIERFEELRSGIGRLG